MKHQQDAYMRIDHEPDRSNMRHPYYAKPSKRRIPARPPHPDAGISDHRQKLIAARKRQQNPYA